MALIQAVVVAMGGRGVLIHGPSGSGKSDLALRLIGRGALLVADDAVEVTARRGRLVASPAADARLFVAGIGAIAVASAAQAVPLSLAVALDPALLRADRLPVLGQYGPVDGLFLPEAALEGLASSTPDKLALALERWGH